MFASLKKLLPRRPDQIGPAAPAAVTADDTSAHKQARAQGNTLVQQGRYVEAEHHYRLALQHRPDEVRTLGGLGFSLREQGRLQEATGYLQQALALDSASPLAVDNHYLCGLIAEELGELEQARKHMALALALKPDFTLASRDLCRLLSLTGDLSGAQDVLHKGMALDSAFGDFHFYQGNLHFENNAPELAVQSYQRALSLGAAWADVYCGLGTAYYKLGNSAQAAESFAQAARLDPGTVVRGMRESGFNHFRYGEHLQAVDDLEKAVARDPEFLEAQSTLLFCLNLLPELAPRYRACAQRFASVVMAKANPVALPRAPARPEGEPLRLGFVSADFRNHPVGFFMESILGQFDRSRFSLFAYSNNARNDHVTARLRPHFDTWRVIRDLKDEQVARTISNDGIDILVDLGGHTSENRLAVFAWRPAPLQLTWLGYFATTGMADIDYIVADDQCVPPQADEYFSEKVWRLPDTRLCMTPPVTAPLLPVAPLPALSAGHVTFGSFQARTKITSGVLSVWARVLAAVPGARLRLQIPTTDVASIREEFLRQLDAAGLDRQRVSLTAGTGWEAYLASYQHVDMVLDTFPYPGGTTTADASWMGVPTLTMAGSTMLSRQGAGMMHCLGLDNWIANSEDAYVAKAAAFASDLPALAGLRAGLRDRAARSPLFDARRFTANLQDAFEGMYRITCR